MTEVLNHWKPYVPDAAHLTQRGATFLFNDQEDLLYEHRDRASLGFASDMSNPLSFLSGLVAQEQRAAIQCSFCHFQKSGTLNPKWETNNTASTSSVLARTFHPNRRLIKLPSLIQLKAA